MQMFGGLVKRYAHQSTQLGCKMHFSLFTPPAATNGNKVPVRSTFTLCQPPYSVLCYVSLLTIL